MPARPGDATTDATASSTTGPPTGLGGRSVGWFLVALVLVSVNLRTPVTSVSALLGLIRTDLGLSGAAVGVLTALPVVGFGAFAFAAPALRHRFGEERVIVGALVALLAGESLRLLGSVAWLFGGTLVVVSAIGVVNATVPALLKRDIPHRFSAGTAVNTVAMMVGASFGSVAVVPIAHATGGGWQLPLGAVALPFAAVALLAWLPRARRRITMHDASARTAGLWRDRLAWQVTGFMGMQVLLAYFVIGWVPTVCQDRGMSAAAGGGVLSVTSLVQVAGTLAIPALLPKLRDQRPLAVLAASLNVLGVAGVIAAPAPAGVWVSAVVLGFGQGVGFGLGLTLIGLRAADASTAAGLSGMAQGVGYLLGIVGTFGSGALHDATGGWTVPLAVLAAAGVLQLVAGLGAGRDRHVLR